MPPPTARRAPYKDFLQPCMQRRFASALLVLLALSYLEAIALSSWRSLIWSWFPLGTAGIRTILIFFCVLFVSILRIAHPHVGIRTSNSPFDTFKKTVLSISASETILTYALSAFLFSQVYLYSVAEQANLQWITYHSGDRARLNERAVFYTLTITLLGFLEGFMHQFFDYDRLVLGTVKETSTGSAAKTEDPFERLLKQASRLVLRSLTTSLSTAAASYLVVYYCLRSSAWGWAMAFFRPFYNLPKTNIPPASAPWSIWMLGRTIAAGTLLCLLWNFGNGAFTAWQAREPIKNGQPLTSESKDPNGSLLNGLKSKKARIASFAMWELALIARDFDARRKAIFEDIDRKDGPMWSQVYSLCMDSVRTLERRIDDYGKPPVPAPATATQQTTAQTKPPPRVVEPPLNANVWKPAPPPTSLRDSLGKLAADVVKSPGKTPAESLVPFAKKTVADVKDSLLSKQRQEQLSRDGLTNILSEVFGWVLRVPALGWPFRQLYSRRITTAILGTPYGDVGLHVNSIYTLSKLAVASLNEDQYGNVQRDVATIIRSLTTVTRKLETFKENFPIHWTDVHVVRQCEDVDGVLDALKDALTRVLGAFEKYSGELKLNRTDIRVAKEAAEKKHSQPAQDAIEPRGAAQQPEMKQVS